MSKIDEVIYSYTSVEELLKSSKKALTDSEYRKGLNIDWFAVLIGAVQVIVVGSLLTGVGYLVFLISTGVLSFGVVALWALAIIGVKAIIYVACALIALRFEGRSPRKKARKTRIVKNKLT